MGKVLKEGRDKSHPLVVGTIKTNIGHTESAAGVAGVIKTVLALNHHQIPAHLHFKKLNPNISLDEIPVVIPTQLMEWLPINGKRIAGVSSFGFSGTNAHVILEEAPAEKIEVKSETVDRPVHVLCVSAKQEESLRSLRKNTQASLSSREV